MSESLRGKKSNYEITRSVKTSKNNVEKCLGGVGVKRGDCEHFFHSR